MSSFRSSTYFLTDFLFNCNSSAYSLMSIQPSLIGKFLKIIILETTSVSNISTYSSHFTVHSTASLLFYCTQNEKSIPRKNNSCFFYSFVDVDVSGTNTLSPPASTVTLIGKSSVGSPSVRVWTFLSFSPLILN